MITNSALELGTSALAEDDDSLVKMDVELELLRSHGKTDIFVFANMVFDAVFSSLISRVKQKWGLNVLGEIVPYLIIPRSSMLGC